MLTPPYINYILHTVTTAAINIDTHIRKQFYYKEEYLEIYGKCCELLFNK
jgi:hypothetical protein